jgi:hypothetical protein
MKRNGTKIRTSSPWPKHWQEEWDWAYSERVYPTLVRKYPNQWVALAHHRVVAAGKDVMKVLAHARPYVAWKEIPVMFVEQGIHVY